MDNMNRSKVIKPLLKKAGETQRRIADFLNVSPQYINQVVLGQRKTDYVRGVIADFCRVEKHVIWPT
jgi:transcriptional regulator with XRE-family HTH domain